MVQHEDEIDFVFGAPSTVASSPGAAAVSRFLMTSYARFLTDLNPNGRADRRREGAPDELQQQAGVWLAFGESGQTLRISGPQPQQRTMAPPLRAAQCDLWQSTLTGASARARSRAVRRFSPA